MIERVDQLVITASPGDAITSMAMDMRAGLRTTVQSDIFALTVLPELRDDVLTLGAMPPSSPSSVLVYHASYGEPRITDLLLKSKQRLVMVYHNITPARFFMAHSSQFATGLLWGRHELDLLRGRFDRVIADSSFNAEDLRLAGYEDVLVLPLGVRPRRLSELPTDLPLAHRTRERFPHGYVIVVAQQLPHKRIDTVIHAMHVVRSVHGLGLGLVVVGPARLPEYSNALRLAADRLQLSDSWFVGSIDDRSLATLLRGATALVSASEHEGLSLPPLEAMASGVPVVVRGAGAVPETVGDAALVLPEDAGALLFAEAIAAVTGDQQLRTALVGRGLRRINELEDVDHLPALLDVIRELG
jgi:glycosyltransferase involved in cell wall biosynthesis